MARCLPPPPVQTPHLVSAVHVILVLYRLDLLRTPFSGVQ